MANNTSPRKSRNLSLRRATDRANGVSKMLTLLNHATQGRVACDDNAMFRVLIAHGL